MNNITFDYSRCDDLVTFFGKDELEGLWNTLFKGMNAFLEIHNLSSAASVDKLLLNNAVTDCFADLKRLKDFTKIKKINSHKIIAYASYWLLRRKPIQIIDPQAKIDDLGELKGLSTLNERFVLQYILDYLCARNVVSPILERDNRGLKNFCGTMLYYLIYRLRDAQSLEMILMAFLAGQIYEQTNEDLSCLLHPYDN